MPLDKLIHALVGIIIGIVVTLLANPVAGVCAAIGVGAAKEWIYDAWMQRGNFEAWDFFATCGGGIVGAVIAYVLPMIGKIV